MSETTTSNGSSSSSWSAASPPSAKTIVQSSVRERRAAFRPARTCGSSSTKRIRFFTFSLRSVAGEIPIGIRAIA
jgi:hypothetical protein